MRVKDIKPDAEYSLQEIVEKEMLPGVSGYATIYNLVTNRLVDGTKKTGYRRILNDQTTNKSIKGVQYGRPGLEISGKIFVRGKDLILFRTLNHCV